MIGPLTHFLGQQGYLLELKMFDVSKEISALLVPPSDPSLGRLTENQPDGLCVAAAANARR